MGWELNIQDDETPLSPERKAALDAWLNVLAAAPVPPAAPGDLAERTLATLRADRMKLQPSDAPANAAEVADPLAAPFRRRWTRRMAEFGAMAVAASLLVAVTVVGLSQSREANRRVACAANLKAWGAAFAAYQADNGSLPSLAMPADRNWLNTAYATAETPRTNASNLSPLLASKLIAMNCLYCPGNMPEKLPATTHNNLGEIGYSYTCLYGSPRPTWNGSAATIIMADKNPLFPNGPALPQKNSANHGERGNYLLRADGNVTWETTPNAGTDRDNIWTVSAGGAGKGGENMIMTYTGVEVPGSAGDTFLVP